MRVSRKIIKMSITIVHFHCRFVLLEMHFKLVSFLLFFVLINANNATSPLIDVHSPLPATVSSSSSSSIAPLQTIFKSVVTLKHKFISNPVMTILSQTSFLFETFISVLKLMPFNEFIMQLKDGVTTAASCLTCNILATVARSDIFSTNLLVFTTKMVCVFFRLSTYTVCHGVIESFKDTFDFIRFNSHLSSGEMCGLALGMNCALEVTENLNWTIPLPNLNNKKVKLRAMGTRKVVAHFTDIHLDELYVIGSQADCNEPVCCRSTSLMLSVPLIAGPFGNYLRCDTPVTTVERAVDRVINSHRLSYVLWTGDIPPHDVWNYTRSSNIMYINEISRILESRVRVPVLPAVGNHEAVPVNSFAPPEIEERLSNAWLYETLANKWSKWLPKSALKTVKYTGNYMVRMEPGFRVISLNTNYCARLNPWVLYKPIDPGDQLKWLVDQLLYAESAGDKVHIIGHVPPDHKECTQPWLFNFIRIVERFQDTITAQFYGHTHRDEFRVLYSSKGQEDAVGFELIAPSVTSYSATNPAYRIYTINENNLITDYHTYYFNLTASHFATEPIWKLEYSASTLYNLNPITSQTLHSALRKMETDSTLYNSYHRIYYTKSDIDYTLDWDNKRRDLLLKSHRVEKPSKPQQFEILDIIST